MKNIRHNVFETNSSSTHSISISHNSSGIYDTIIPDEDGVITLTGGKFGWAWESFNDPMTKASYCAVDRQNISSDKEMLERVIKKHTGAKKVVMDFSLDYSSPTYSYIDHQSVGTAAEAFASDETLKDFIFNPKSFLFTGNDNEESPPNFFDVDPSIKYNYELSIKDCSLTEKFISSPSEEDLKESISRLVHTSHPDIKNYNSKWRFYSYSYDNSPTSYDKIGKNIVLLFKENSKYDKSGQYIGNKIVETIELKFKIKEI